MGTYAVIWQYSNKIIFIHFNIANHYYVLNSLYKKMYMRLHSLLLILALGLVSLIGCKKKKEILYTPYVNPADNRIGVYHGMFQECGPSLCYNIDTTFQITKVNNQYFLQFGNHTDELFFTNPNALDFHSVASYALDSSGQSFGNYFGGWCTADSVYVKFSDGWGVHNNNLLSGKKQ